MTETTAPIETTRVRPSARVSRAILRAAFTTLRAHPSLVAFPVLSGLAIALVVGNVGFIVRASEVLGTDASIGGPLSLFADAPLSFDEAHRRGRVVASLWTLFGTYFVSYIGAVALAHATFEALAGRSWTLRGSLRAANGRLGAIATVAILHAGLSRILQGGRGRGFGRTLKEVIGLAWWAATYLLVPVIARECRTGVDSITRSAHLFRTTWSEAFIGRLALGWVWLGLGVVLVVPIALCALLRVEEGWIVALAIGIPLALAGVAAVALRTLDVIYRTALYVFATEGVVPEPFDIPELHDVWKVKPEPDSAPQS